MIQYKFRWEKQKKLHERTIVGSLFDKDQDKMRLFYPDGGIEEIAHWKDCSVRLGSDWALAQKAAMEKEAGTTIPVNLQPKTEEK